MPALSWALSGAALMLVAAATLFRNDIRARPRLAWLAVVAGGVLLGVHLAAGDRQYLLLPVYLGVLIGGGRVAWLARRAPSPGRRGWRIGLGLLALLVLVADTLVVRVIAAVGDSNELFASRRAPPDIRGLGWAEGFRAVTAFLAEDYAFGAWRRVNFDSLNALYRPQIAVAQRERDWKAYYTAVREYLWSIPDGHIGIEADSLSPATTHIAAGYGIAVARLADGRVVAAVVLDRSPAARAGVRWGAEVVRWNDQPIDSALAVTPVLWSGSPPATTDARGLFRLTLIARDTVGAPLRLGFRNPGDSIVRDVRLTAEADGLQAMRTASGPPIRFLRDRPVEWRMLPDGTGYLRIRYEFPSLQVPVPDLTVRRAVREFTRRSASGVIIDIRGNPGGADRLVPLMMAYFLDQPMFYETATFFDEKAGRFVADSHSVLRVLPADDPWRGPVVTIIDERCGSSCEGIAMVMRRRPNSEVLGFASTVGAFGMGPTSLALPGGITIEYPNGQSVDSAGRVQIDSDWTGAGGVAPSVRLPTTMERLRRRYREGGDPLLEEAQAMLRRMAGKGT